MEQHEFCKLKDPFDKRFVHEFGFYNEYPVVSTIWKPFQHACYVYYKLNSGVIYRVNIYKDIVSLLNIKKPKRKLRKKIVKTQPETLHISSRLVAQTVYASHVAKDDVEKWLERATAKKKM